MSIYNKNNLAIAGACSADSVRPEISGVLFKKDRTVATDSYMMIEVVNPAEMLASESEYPAIPNEKHFVNFPKSGLIIPAVSVNKVKKNLAEVKNQILPILQNCVFLSPRTAGISLIASTDLEKTDIVSVKSIDGQYPNYNRILQNIKGANISVSLDIAKLKQIIDILSTMNLLLDGRIKITVNEKNEPFVIKAETKENQQITAVIMPLRS